MFPAGFVFLLVVLLILWAVGMPLWLLLIVLLLAVVCGGFGLAR